MDDMLETYSSIEPQHGRVILKIKTGLAEVCGYLS